MFELLALACAALFTGAAIYIMVAEQPARLALDDAALLASSAFGLVARWRTRDAAALAGAVAA